MTNNNRVIVKKDWENVLKTMNQYNREGGFVDFVENKLTFFDSCPCINGVNGFYVTKNEVIKYINP
jgi:hypothetical protein